MHIVLESKFDYCTTIINYCCILDILLATFTALSAIILSFVVGMGFLCVPVYGHASPTTYNPQTNQIFHSIQSIPDKLTIVFSETPEIKASSIKVTDEKNIRVDKNDLSSIDSGKTLSISLDKSKIHLGTYTVNWLVLSKDDGHITKGAYVFSLDNNNSSKQQQQSIISNHSLPIYSKSFIKDNVNLTLAINPLKAGNNTFNLTAVSLDGKPVGNITNVFLTFNNPNKDIGPIPNTMKQISIGKYSSNGNFISQIGDWEIKAFVQRTGAYDINQTFDIKIQ
jgi:methionine-rich copper-binding protein CopC